MTVLTTKYQELHKLEITWQGHTTGTIMNGYKKPRNSGSGILVNLPNIKHTGNVLSINRYE